MGRKINGRDSCAYLHVDYLTRAQIFISYCRRDWRHAKTLVTALKSFGFSVVWDRQIPGGEPYRRKIVDAISTSAALMVVWSKSTGNSPWVNNEIGIALGRGVRVIYANVGGELPRGIEDTQAVPLHAAASLLRERIDTILRHQAESNAAGVSVEIVDDSAGRAELLAKEAEGVAKDEFLRQAATFSSFAIPRMDPTYTPEAWNLRDGAVPRNERHRSWQYHERMSLEALAVKNGARIIISPRMLRRGVSETRARLETLRDFLVSESATKVAVHVCDAPIHGDRTILGDKLYALAFPGGPHGFARTFFTSHVATILAEVRRFDAAFGWPLVRDAVGLRASRADAVTRIENLLA